MIFLLTNFKRRQCGETRGDGDEARKIVCIKDAANDTLLYMCDNDGEGWTIYSSDTRVPPIVAQSEIGTIEDLQKLEPAMTWIQTMAEDMKAIKLAEDSKLNFSKEEIEHNKMFWKSISNPDEFAKAIISKKPPMINPGPIDIIDWEKYGHYEYKEEKAVYEYCDVVERLTKTDWHQDTPFNKFCPYKSNCVDRAPAGCVAIASAQVLLYLHNKLGCPVTAPSKAYCYGSVLDFPNYNWNQYDYNSTVWDSMVYNASNSAPLVADVGRRVRMEYGNSVSGAQMNILPSLLFADYGISCQYSTYDPSIVEENLLKGIPVILGAFGSNIGGSSGHAFIADKFQRRKATVYRVYEWIYDKFPTNEDGTLIPIPLIEDRLEYCYETDYLPMIGMNWGEGNGNG